MDMASVLTGCAARPGISGTHDPPTKRNPMKPSASPINALVIICLSFVSASAQQQNNAAGGATDSLKMICKGDPTPTGFVIAGEAAFSECPTGAWILRPRGKRISTPPEDSPRAVGYANDEEGESEPPERQASNPSSAAAARAITSLNSLVSALEVGMTHTEYSVLLRTAKWDVEKALKTLPSSRTRGNLEESLNLFMEANELWLMMIKSRFDWISADNAHGRQLMSKHQIPSIRMRTGQLILTRADILNAIWSKARDRVRDAQ